MTQPKEKLSKIGIIKRVFFLNKSVDPSNARDHLVTLVAGTKCECEKRRFVDSSNHEKISYIVACKSCINFSRIMYELRHMDKN